MKAFVPEMLCDHARLRPDTAAFTFIDYDVDPAGFTETLTWSQTYERAQAIARELTSCASPGDRVAIVAPQSLDYIVGLLGAMVGGFVAVPLSVPLLGTHDERVTAVLQDCEPAAVLTTSAAASDVASCLRTLSGPVPSTIEVNAVDDFDDLDAPTVTPVDFRRNWTALLQYTSGSTRAPAGVVVTHRNLATNLDQIRADYFEDTGGVPPADTTLVSWLPLFHDMGLILGIFGPIAYGLNSVLMSPMAFLQKPGRWMQVVARHSRPVSPAPNFAYELAARRTSDDDMAGLDLGHVLSLVTGAERVHAATIRRFTDRFSRFNLPDIAIRSAYGLAEATVYVSSALPQRPLPIVRFSYEKLADGYAERCDEAGVELVSHGPPRACTVRIVNPDTCVENPAGKVGEIWVNGDNVAEGYWRNRQAPERSHFGTLVDPSPGTPARPWLRTGDLGVISDGELFIVGRIKDLLIVDGRNHYPDDIEATAREISGGRTAAISVDGDCAERLVLIVEVRKRWGSEEEARQHLDGVKREVVSAISRSHGVQVADLVLVEPGSIPITTSGKIRRSASAERYRLDQFVRLEPCA